MKNRQELENDFSEDDFWSEDEIVPKKRLPKWLIICFVSLFLLSLVIILDARSEDDFSLYVVPVSRGRVVETYNANGTIESERTQVFHSPVNAPISEVNVQIGDRVRAGDLIIAYDLDHLEMQYQQTGLQFASTQYGNQATVEMSGLEQERQNQDTQQQNTREENLRAEIAALDEEIEQLREVETAESEQLQELIEELQEERLENRGQHSRLVAERSGLTLSLQEMTTTPEERDALRTEIARIDGDIVLLDDEMREIDRQLETAQLASLSVSSEERLLLQQEVGNLRFTLANMESTPSFPVSNPEITSGQWQSMQTTEELLELSMLSAQELLERAEAGISVEFDGIIASLFVSEGSIAMQGGVLFTLVSNQDVVVKLEIPANNFDRIIVGNEATVQLGDQAYNGRVERVNRVATPNAIGQMVIEAVVSIEEPDDDLFVGVPARVILTVEERQDVLYLPSEVISMTTSGHFVYVLVDGVVERRFVEIGIASSHQIEIISGVEYGELVVADASMVELEGMQAVPLLRE